jgi:hypothetical protein
MPRLLIPPVNQSKIMDNIATAQNENAFLSHPPQLLTKLIVLLSIEQLIQTQLQNRDICIWIHSALN